MSTDTTNLPVEILPNARPEVPDIVRRMLQGEEVSFIAKDYSRSGRALYYWLTKGIGDDGKQAIREEVHASRLCESEADMAQAQDMFQLARAKAVAKRVEWLAEKLLNSTYGNKPVVESKPIEVIVNR